MGYEKRQNKHKIFFAVVIVTRLGFFVSCFFLGGLGDGGGGGEGALLEALVFIVLKPILLLKDLTGTS